MAATKRGMRRGLSAYGDEVFLLFLRKAFNSIKAMGYTDDALDRPVIDITNPIHLAVSTPVTTRASTVMLCNEALCMMLPGDF